MNRIIIKIGLILVILSGNVSAQTLNEAKKLFAAGEYDQVKPFFERRVKSAPANALNNLWYGVCLFETGEVEEAEKYLYTAYLKKEPAANLPLAKIYYGSYRFDEAVQVCDNYLNSAKNTNNRSEISYWRDRAKNAGRMLLHCEDIRIIDSLIVDKSDFVKHYQLSEEAGTIRYGNDGMVIYENQLKDKRYFPRLTDTLCTNLFYQNKFLDSWGEEISLGFASDTIEIQNYPYVLSDGVTVYYASTRPDKSIGGYDLFVTRYNYNNGSYYLPEQLGMPFNSIYNDYMLVLDEYSGLGYFASDRFMEEGKVVIYTFVPNKERQAIEDNADEVYLRNRAQITDIRASWREGENYEVLLSEARAKLTTHSPQTQRDFTFAIDDHTIYYTIADFKNGEAKSLFLQGQKMRQQLEQTEHLLEKNRLDYARGNASARQMLGDSILKMESELERMDREYNQLVKQIRNAEIRHLHRNN